MWTITVKLIYEEKINCIIYIYIYITLLRNAKNIIIDHQMLSESSAEILHRCGSRLDVNYKRWDSEEDWIIIQM